jgi:hypothetical protein
VRPDVVHFVSVLSRRPRSTLSTPINFPDSGTWLLKILGWEGRFVYGLYRRQIKAIGYLGSIDQLFGAPATTLNWNTFTAIANVLSPADCHDPTNTLE